MGVIERTEIFRDKQALLWRQQQIVRTVVAAAILTIAFAGYVLLAPLQLTQPAPKLSEPSTFILTPDQLLNLTIEPVSEMTFRSETETDGFIAPDEDISTPVFSPFSGRVTKIFAKLGDHVRQGAALMTVEASEFVQAQSDLITAKAQFNLAATNEKRQHDLYEAQGAALRDWQQSQVDLAASEAALSAVRNKLRIFGRTESEIAKLEQMRAQPSSNAESIVSAPISGLVILRRVGLGQYIQAGSSDPVFSIGDSSKVWLVANVREADTSLVHLGDVVEVRVPASPDRIFKAKVSYVAPGIDPATRRLAVRAEVDNSEGLLKPQMFGQFTIVTGDQRQALGIPARAILYEGKTARVWVENPDRSLSPREIKTGRSSNGMVEVPNGLALGDRVVTGGALFIDRATTNRG